MKFHEREKITVTECGKCYRFLKEMYSLKNKKNCRSRNREGRAASWEGESEPIGKTDWARKELIVNEERRNSLYISFKKR